MSDNAHIYLNIPERFGSRTVVGSYKIGDIKFTGQTVNLQRVLDIEIQSLRPYGQTDTDEHYQYEWLQLDVAIWTVGHPHRKIGTVHTAGEGMMPIGVAGSLPSYWRWELRDEDIERANAAHALLGVHPFSFVVEITGVAKKIDGDGQGVDVVALRSDNSRISVAFSDWQSLITDMGFTIPPSTAGLAGYATTEHPSWTDASTRLDDARAQLRAGDDYNALQDCLGALESLVSRPYDAAEWRGRLAFLPPQKAAGLAELFSGLAMFCNKIGHHRSRDERDHDTSLRLMPLDHWEAEAVVAATQFVLTYALRLRSTGDLSLEPPEAQAKPIAGQTGANGKSSEE
jgi:hypothetical protein